MIYQTISDIIVSIFTLLINFLFQYIIALDVNRTKYEVYMLLENGNLIKAFFGNRIDLISCQIYLALY